MLVADLDAELAVELVGLVALVADADEVGLLVDRGVGLLAGEREAAGERGALGEDREDGLGGGEFCFTQ